MKNGRYTAVLLGAGSIGALKPNEFDSPDTEEILTHAHAIYNHPKINLLGIIDSNINKAKKAGNKWKKTGEGKLISGLVGGYMKHRTQINKGLKSINFAD